MAARTADVSDADVALVDRWAAHTIPAWGSRVYTMAGCLDRQQGSRGPGEAEPGWHVLDAGSPGSADGAPADSTSGLLAHVLALAAAAKALAAVGDGSKKPKTPAAVPTPDDRSAYAD